MTVRDPSTQVTSDVVTVPARPPVGGHAALRILLISVLGMALLSLTRIISGADDITSAGALGGTINAAMPIMLAGLGGLWSERSGVANIGLEGQMILGTWFGAEFAFATHSAWMLLVGGIVGGFIGGALHAIATVGFGVDQIVSGVAINILAPGIAKYLAGIYFNKPAALAAGGGPTQSPQVDTFGPLKWTWAANHLEKLEQHHWFFVSDLAGLLEGICTSLNVLTIIALLTIPATWFVLWRTSLGLRLRSCGENPDAAESLGVKVYTMKSTAVIISGILAGVAGAFLVNFTGIYRENQTAGRGYIGLAAMIFGNWRPLGLAAGSGLFGYTDALQQRQGSTSVHALLIVVGVLLVLLGLYRAVSSRGLPYLGAVALGGLFVAVGVHSVQRSQYSSATQVVLIVIGVLLLGGLLGLYRAVPTAALPALGITVLGAAVLLAGVYAAQHDDLSGVVQAVVVVAGAVLLAAGLVVGHRRGQLGMAVSVAAGALVLVAYLVTDSIPSQFATYTPQIITLLVLAVASQRLRMPAADGLPWRRRGS